MAQHDPAPAPPGDAGIVDAGIVDAGIVDAGIVDVLARHISAAAAVPLPAEVRDATVLHLLDTVAATVSGRWLPAGKAGERFARSQQGPPTCTVLGSSLRSSPSLAALANGMAAHADETDDSHAPSRTHPGCAVVPAALAMAESRRRSGAQLVRAVALGYELCGRVPRALWPPTTIDRGERRTYSTHAFGGLFGAAAASAALAQLSDEQCRYLLSYATQQASGIRSFFREREHIEKAFVFAGMPAMNGTLSAELVACGWTGVTDVFSGTPSFFSLAEAPAPEVLTDGLGERFEVLATKFKKYPAGSPIQSPMEGVLTLLRDHQLDGAQVAAATVAIPVQRWQTVHARDMADINIDYLLEIALTDGRLDFAAAHDEERFRRWQEAPGPRRVRVLADDTLAGHSARVVLETTDGRRLERYVPAIPGSADNPMSATDVIDKATALLAPVLGADRAAAAVDLLTSLDEVDDLRELTALLAVPESRRNGPRGVEDAAC